jgi:hypothetical protein
VALPDGDVVDVTDPDPVVVPDEPDVVSDEPDVEVADGDDVDVLPDTTVVVLEAAVDGVSACVRKLSTATTPTAVALRT